jgi:hypothetical protein
MRSRFSAFWKTIKWYQRLPLNPTSFYMICKKRNARNRCSHRDYLLEPMLGLS